MIILVCGSRNASKGSLDRRYQSAIEERIKLWHQEHGDKLMILEGGCSGADLIAADIAWEEGIPVIQIDANWDVYGKKAGPIRNRWMLRLHPDLVVGFHHDWDLAKGTTDMIKAAEKAKIETLRIRV